MLERHFENVDSEGVLESGEVSFDVLDRGNVLGSGEFIVITLDAEA